MRINQCVSFIATKTSVIFYTPSKKITINGQQDFISKLYSHLLEMQEVRNVRTTTFFKFFNTEEQDILRELVKTGLLVENTTNPFADAVSFHKTTENPNNYLPHLSQKDIELLLKNRHNILNKNLCSLSEEFQYLTKRRSVRTNVSPSVSLKKIEMLCNIGYGTLRVENEIIHKTTPSAGCFYPITLHYIDLQENILYIFTGAKLNMVRKLDAKEFSFANLVNRFTDLSNWKGIIISTADLKQICGKYGPKGYALTLIEAGHIMQNIIHGATKDEIANLEIGCLYDRDILNVLNLNNERTIYIVGMLVGGYAEDTNN